MREVKVPSVIPVYALGGIWLVYALLFPMYRWADFLIATLLSVGAYFVLSRMIPPKVEVVEDKPVPIRTGNAAHDEQLRQWQAYRRELAALRKQISDAGIGAKLDSILASSDQMFELLKADAGKFHLVRTFSTYYFPTTISLMKRYADYEDNPNQGSNVTTAMRKIETAVDTIEKAFHDALDRLYRDEALQTEVEVEVMEQMLRKDGLGGANDPFMKK